MEPYTREPEPPMTTKRALKILLRTAFLSPFVMIGAGLGIRVLVFLFKLGYSCFGLW